MANLCKPCLGTPARALREIVDALNTKVAPSGYGLGADPTYVSDANTCKSNGWFYIDNNTANKPTHINYADLFVYRRNYAEYAQEVVDVTRGLKAIRHCYDGATWSEWAYDNPPMELGVEYRTTERWNGQPVYTKLVDCGAWVHSGFVDTGISAVPIRFSGVTNAGNALPYINGAIDNAYTQYVTVMTQESTIRIYMYGGASASSPAKVQIWYVKQ